MKKQNSITTSLSIVALVTAMLLAIPLVANSFTGEVNWTLSDFIFAGILLFGTGAIYVFISRKSDSIMYRTAVGLTLFSALFLIWSNLAVGIIGPEDNVANFMYFGVVLILIMGSALSRFRPHGMALALFSTALAQAATVPAALFMGMQNTPGSSAMEIILLNGLFITLFMISGVLFWQAEKDQISEQVSSSI